MKSVLCPQCGSSKTGMGGAYDDAPPLSAPIVSRADWWINRGDVGVSSQTIWSAMTGGAQPRYGPDIPYDPDDFSRCYKLLALIPEWRSELSSVAKRYPWWKPYVDNWDELECMYIAQVEAERKARGRYKGPFLMYYRMKQLEAQSRRLRSGAR